MINASNFIHIPYAHDLTEGGIAFALRSLQYSFDLSPQHLRRVAAEAAVELAFRRYLSQQEIPFEVKSAAPFTDPRKFNATLGGHRCDIKSFFISHPSQIAEMRRDPNVILNAPALVPSDHHMIDGYSDRDLYLFAFLSGRVAASQTDLKKTIETNQPYYLIHAMPERWRKPLTWNPLGGLVLKSESDEEMLVEVSGQDEARGFLTRLVNLPAKIRVTVEENFFRSHPCTSKPCLRRGWESIIRLIKNRSSSRRGIGQIFGCMDLRSFWRVLFHAASSASAQG